MGQWAEQPRAAMLPDGKRLHLQHGPIDLVIGANGARQEVAKAYQQAATFFKTVLPTLAGELPLLRRPWSEDMPDAGGAIARDMQARAAAHGQDEFVTPMICVAGAVADHVLNALCHQRELENVYVNNGGDIALWLAPGEHFDVGVCGHPQTGEVSSTVRVRHGDGIGGIATSGWRGRSFSFGIADAVTVLAADAATADTAATLIANAVDVPGAPEIERAPASTLAPDSDLGDRLVTVSVGELSHIDVTEAINAGARRANQMIAENCILAAYIAVQDQTVTCGHPPSPAEAQPDQISKTCDMEHAHWQ